MMVDVVAAARCIRCQYPLLVALRRLYRQRDLTEFPATRPLDFARFLVATGRVNDNDGTVAVREPSA